MSFSFFGKKPSAAPVLGRSGEPLEQLSLPPKPEPLLQPVPTVQQTAQTVLDEIYKSEYRLLALPTGVSAQDGFLIVSANATTWVLRRSDMDTRPVGYFDQRAIAKVYPHAKLIDVSASDIRAVQEGGTGARRKGQASESVNLSQQQGYDLVAAAIAVDASDIHIDVERKGSSAKVLIRFRVTGQLEDYREYGDEASAEAHQEILRGLFQNDLNSLASERNTGTLSETVGRFYGRLNLPVKGSKIRFESNTTNVGSTTNLRVLDYDGKPKLSTNFAGLGFSTDQANALYKAFVQAKQGLILVMGPTGGGKTQTVQTGLSMDPDAKKQYSVGMEQPPELVIPYMQQLAFADDDFEEAFKGVLRLDPDVIYIGEALNAKVAQLSVRAAMTGHLVPMTLHGNNIATGLRRMLGRDDMAISAEDLAADDMLQAISYQRLVATLCTECRVPAESKLDHDTLDALVDLDLNTQGMYVRYEGDKACVCKGRGIRNRTVLAEVLRPTPDWRNALLEQGVQAAMQIYSESREASFHEENQTGKTAFEHGLYKAHIGMICIEELLSKNDPTLHPYVLQKRKVRSIHKLAAVK